jgi:hypothetical protein
LFVWVAHLEFPSRCNYSWGYSSLSELNLDVISGWGRWPLCRARSFRTETAHSLLRPVAIGRHWTNVLGRSLLMSNFLRARPSSSTGSKEFIYNSRLRWLIWYAAYAQDNGFICFFSSKRQKNVPQVKIQQHSFIKLYHVSYIYIYISHLILEVALSKLYFCRFEKNSRLALFFIWSQVKLLITNNSFCIVQRATAQSKTGIFRDYGVAEASSGVSSRLLFCI